MTYRQSFHVEAPVTEVFAFFSDPSRWAELEPAGVRFGQVVLTPEGVGTHYSWSARVAGVPMQGFNVFTAFVPERRITDRSSSSLEGTWTYTFEPEGSGTRLTVENRVGACWRLPLLERVLDRVTASTHAPRFQRLTQMLEA
jgi:carbon monoxide dehydrogenase subunit G